MPTPKKELKPIFGGLTIATTGDLGGQFTEANIIRWVTQRGGAFSHSVNENVTHLVCTLPEFKKKGPKVSAAVGYGAKKCHLVSVDWLEDSLVKSRKLAERPYLMRSKHKIQKRDDAKQGAGNDGPSPRRTEDNRFVDVAFYKTYQDSTYFQYSITITRNEPTHGERYLMTLFESKARPAVFIFGAKYFKSKTNTHAHYYRGSDSPVTFVTAFKQFTDFFRLKTGIEWDERVVKAGTMGPEYFHYRPPIGGKPVGAIENAKNLPKFENDIFEEPVPAPFAEPTASPSRGSLFRGSPSRGSPSRKSPRKSGGPLIPNIIPGRPRSATAPSRNYTLPARPAAFWGAAATTTHTPNPSSLPARPTTNAPNIPGLPARPAFNAPNIPGLPIRPTTNAPNVSSLPTYPTTPAKKAATTTAPAFNIPTVTVSPPAPARAPAPFPLDVTDVGSDLLQHCRLDRSHNHYDGPDPNTVREMALLSPPKEPLPPYYGRGVSSSTCNPLPIVYPDSDEEDERPDLSTLLTMKAPFNMPRRKTTGGNNFFRRRNKGTGTRTGAAPRRRTAATTAAAAAAAAVPSSLVPITSFGGADCIFHGDPPTVPEIGDPIAYIKREMELADCSDLGLGDEDYEEDKEAEKKKRDENRRMAAASRKAALERAKQRKENAKNAKFAMHAMANAMTANASANSSAAPSPAKVKTEQTEDSDDDVFMRDD